MDASVMGSIENFYFLETHSQEHCFIDGKKSRQYVSTSHCGVTASNMSSVFQTIFASTCYSGTNRLIGTSQIPQVPIHKSSSGLSLTDVDEVTLNSVVKVAGVDRLTLKQATLNPTHLTAALLVHKQPGTELLGLNLEETSQLLQVHGGVELEVGLDSWVEESVLHLVHEDSSVVVDGVDVEGWVVEVRRGRGDELGASGSEELLEQRQGLRTATLETVELLAVLLTQGGVDGVVQTSGVEGDTDGDQSVHLVVLLGDSIIAVSALLEVLRPRDVDQNVAEHADSVGIAAHHHVGETYIIIGGEVSSHDASKHGLLVHLNVVEGLESKAEVSQQTVDPQKSDDGKVTQHLVQRARAVLSSHSQWILISLDSSQLLVDLRSLDEGVQDVQN